MKGDGYDIEHPSDTPFNGAVGIYSTDGTLGQRKVKHSVKVLDPGGPGEALGTWPEKGSKVYRDAPIEPAVASKGGITAYVVTTPQMAWSGPEGIKYYGKKAGQ